MFWTKSGKSTRGSQEALLLIFVIWGWCFDCQWMRVGGAGKKVSFAFSFFVLLKEMRSRSQSKIHLVAHLVALVWIKITKRQGEFRILLCNSSGGKILLRASAGYTNLLGGVALRILQRICNEAPPAKATNGLKTLTVSTEELPGRH